MRPQGQRSDQWNHEKTQSSFNFARTPFESADMERQRPQSVLESGVHGLANHILETRHTDVHRDHADIFIAPEFVIRPSDPAKALWRIYNIQKPQRMQKIQGTGDSFELE